MRTKNENCVFWVDDVVQINPDACSYSNDPIDSSLKGNNFNWIVTEVYPPDNKLTLGAYRAFGSQYFWSPPLEVHASDVSMIELACRHPDTVVDAAVAPTCTTEGKTEGKRCTCEDCGKILVESKPIPALQHDFGYDATTDKYVCTRCGHEEIIPPKVVDLTSGDIKTLIKIIENMLERDS